MKPKLGDRMRAEPNPPRYILNKTWLGMRVIVHDKENLTERCNTDQIKRRREARVLDPRWRKCRHCWPA